MRWKKKLLLFTVITCVSTVIGTFIDFIWVITASTLEYKKSLKSKVFKYLDWHLELKYITFLGCISSILSLPIFLTYIEVNSLLRWNLFNVITHLIGTNWPSPRKLSSSIRCLLSFLSLCWSDYIKRWLNKVCTFIVTLIRKWPI